MQLGMIGLGRMGGNIVRRLMKSGHSAVVYDKNEEAVAAVAADGAAGAKALEDFVAKLETPRTAWVMLPAGKITEATIEAVAQLMQAGDVIIDGGNTFWAARRPWSTGSIRSSHALRRGSATFPAREGARDAIPASSRVTSTPAPLAPGISSR